MIGATSAAARPVDTHAGRLFVFDRDIGDIAVVRCRVVDGTDSEAVELGYFELPLSANQLGDIASACRAARQRGVQAGRNVKAAELREALGVPDAWASEADV